jgi:copper chaperone CopZ
MIRRKFLGLMTVAGAGGLVTLAHAGEKRTVQYHIEGFTCITCAVGLEVLLQNERGVVWAKASYPDRTAKIVFHADLVSEEKLEAFITDAGFTAQREQA